MSAVGIGGESCPAATTPAVASPFLEKLLNVSEPEFPVPQAVTTTVTATATAIQDPDEETAFEDDEDITADEVDLLQREHSEELTTIMPFVNEAVGETAPGTVAADAAVADADSASAVDGDGAATAAGAAAAELSVSAETHMFLTEDLLGETALLPFKEYLSTISFDSEISGGFSNATEIEAAQLSPDAIDELLQQCCGLAIPPSAHALTNAVSLGVDSTAYLLTRSRWRGDLGATADAKSAFHAALLTANSKLLQILLSPPFPSPIPAQFCEPSAPYDGLPPSHLAVALAGRRQPAVSDCLMLLTAYNELCDAARKTTEGLSLPEICVARKFLGWGEGTAEVAAWQFMQLGNSVLGSGSLNATDTAGVTALHRAAQRGCASTVKRLLDLNADPCLRTAMDDLPLHWAIDGRDPETFALLLRRGADLPLPLFRRCILAGAWRCLGRLMTDGVYSQMPISEADVDHLLAFAGHCGFEEEFSEAFQMAVDETQPTGDGSGFHRKNSAESISQQQQQQALMVFTHESCSSHLPLDMQCNSGRTRKLLERFPENPSRLFCLTDAAVGVMGMSQLASVPVVTEFPPAPLADLLRVHDWAYIDRLLRSVAQTVDIGETKMDIEVLDVDTPVTAQSWVAASRAAGAVLAAVQAVAEGKTMRAFCAVRPPGHHVGTWGACQNSVVTGATTLWSEFSDEDNANGSQGFCLLNNIAIGAAFARYRYGPLGVRRIAIIDFDIHHGNGTEQTVLNLRPRLRSLKSSVGGGDATVLVEFKVPYAKLWLDESDADEVFFASIHGFGGSFYPGTGLPRPNCPNICNVTLPEVVSPSEVRAAFLQGIVMPLAQFAPDLILVSAGFDGHNQDIMGSVGFSACCEEDFAWMTRCLAAVANDSCKGRIVSVLEGGYNTKGDSLSPLARSVEAHLLALSRTPAGLSLTSLLSATVALQQDVLTNDKKRQRDTSSSPAANAAAGLPKRQRRAAAVRALRNIDRQVAAKRDAAAAAEAAATAEASVASTVEESTLEFQPAEDQQQQQHYDVEFSPVPRRMEEC